MADQWLNEQGLTGDHALPLVLLQPGARYSLKVWPPERFAQLSDRLVERFHCRILLGGDQREREVAEQVARKRIARRLWWPGNFPYCSMPRW